jgi:hypothetical protein
MRQRTVDERQALRMAGKRDVHASFVFASMRVSLTSRRSRWSRLCCGGVHDVGDAAVLSFVQVPESPAEHRSFWQVPDVKQLLHRDEKSPGLRKRHYWLPGDSAAR